MFLLQSANVTVDVNKLPYEHLITILLFVLVLIAVVIINGISFKWGEKEFNIGGIRRLLAKKDEDTHLKENLKRFADDVDHEIQADLYDLVEDIDDRIDKVFVQKHCYFTMEKFSNLVKRELQKRVRRNNLKEKLAEVNREKYIDRALRDVQERYDLFQGKVAATACEDKYADFSIIKEAVRSEIGLFFDKAKLILITGMRKKRNRYKEAAVEFKTVSARRFCCDKPDAKNKGYIEQLTAGTEPAGTWY